MLKNWQLQLTILVCVATKLDHLEWHMQIAHAVQIVIDHKLQNVGYMRFVGIEVATEYSAALE